MPDEPFPSAAAAHSRHSARVAGGAAARVETGADGARHDGGRRRPDSAGRRRTRCRYARATACVHCLCIPSILLKMEMFLDYFIVLVTLKATEICLSRLLTTVDIFGPIWKAKFNIM